MAPDAAAAGHATCAVAPEAVVSTAKHETRHHKLDQCAD